MRKNIQFRAEIWIQNIFKAVNSYLQWILINLCPIILVHITIDNEK